MKKILLPMALLWVVTSFGKTQPAEPVSTPSPEIPAADTVAMTEQEIDGHTSATAVANAPSFNGIIMLSPKKHVTITLPMGGSLHSVNLFPGKYVEKGAELATLENMDFITLQQQYLETASQVEFLEKEYQRQESLALKEAASQKRLQQSKADYLAMKSKMDASAAQLQILGVSPAKLKRNGISPYMSITAPISGYVTNLDLNVGKYFNSGDPICDIIDKSAPILQLTAYEKDLSHLKIGDKFDFHVNGMGAKSFKATLFSIDQMVNETNRSINLYLNIEDPVSEFRPGMYVSATKIR